MKALGRLLKRGPECPYCATQPMRRVVIHAPQRKWYIPGERRHHCGKCGTRVRCVSGQVAYRAWFWSFPVLAFTGILRELRVAVGDYPFYALLAAWVAGGLFLWSRIRWEKYFANPRGTPPAEPGPAPRESP
jgi:hypothetical protein